MGPESVREPKDGRKLAYQFLKGTGPLTVSITKQPISKLLIDSQGLNNEMRE
jgi:hypothetical protein